MNDVMTKMKGEFSPYMTAEPLPEHRWLQRFVGEWAFEGDCDMGPGQPRMKSTGRERVRGLGGLWIVAEGEGEMPCGNIGHTLLTVGFDPVTRRYVGSWVGSMMSYPWRYDGEVDAGGTILTLNAEGPNFAAGKGTARYQDIIEFVSDDHRIFRSRALGADGKWHEFMIAHYRRTK